MRRPRFALVLLAIAAAVLALLATTRHGPAPITAAPNRPTNACVTARATAQTTVHTSVEVHARVSYPVAVTERVERGANIISVTREARIIEQAGLDRPISVTARAVAPGRACATARSAQAAKTLALRQAYKSALAAAHRRSAAAATRRARQLAAGLEPAELAQARRLGIARAQQEADALKPSLARKALAQATAEAQRAS